MSLSPLNSEPVHICHAVALDLLDYLISSHIAIMAAFQRMSGTCSRANFKTLPGMVVKTTLEDESISHLRYPVQLSRPKSEQVDICHAVVLDSLDYHILPPWLVKSAPSGAWGVL